MKNRTKIAALAFAFLALCLLVSCDKDYLEAKPDKSILVPSKLKDFQAILDNSSDVFNREPGLNMISADDFYTTSEGMLNSGTVYENNSYLWLEDLFMGNSIEDWNLPYKQVFYSNIVLDGLKEASPSPKDQSEWNRVKGTALFYRGYAFYNLAQLFAAPYAENALHEAGLPLRLTADVNTKVTRSSLKETYERILNDLSEAAGLLPVQTEFTTQPTKAAAYAILARLSQTMQKYEDAKKYADSCLQIKSALLDYNLLNPAANRPFPVALPQSTNVEIIFYSTLLTYTINRASLTIADSTLYRSYDPDDLRRDMFFVDRGEGVINFKGSYSGRSTLCGGLNTDEVYLIRAESYARMGDKDLALTDLNTLMEKRWKTGKFIPFTALTAADALYMVLQERRKELVTRGLRWADLRRLNQDIRFAKKLDRKIGGLSYTLEPNDKRYVFPIPQNEIAASGIQQNPR